MALVFRRLFSPGGSGCKKAKKGHAFVKAIYQCWLYHLCYKSNQLVCFKIQGSTPLDAFFKFNLLSLSWQLTREEPFFSEQILKLKRAETIIVSHSGELILATLLVWKNFSFNKSWIFYLLLGNRTTHHEFFVYATQLFGRGRQQQSCLVSMQIEFGTEPRLIEGCAKKVPWVESGVHGSAKERQWENIM